MAGRTRVPYRLLVESARDVVYCLTATGKVTYVSPQVERFGWRPLDLLDGSFLRCVHPDDAERMKGEFRRAVAAGDETPATFRILGRHGCVYWVESRTRVLRGPNRRPSHLIGIVRDVSEKRRAAIEMRRIAWRLIDVQEQERSELSAWLHDDVAQLVVLMGMECEAVRPADDASAAALARVRDGIRRVLTAIRGRATALHPPILDGLSLTDAVRSLSDDVATATRLDVRVTTLKVPASLTLPQRICLYRIAQEALLNAVKHARARRIRVRLAGSRKGVVLRIQDDGKGFDASASKAGVGLITSRERVERAGGRLRIESAPGRGTVVQAEVPLSMKPAPDDGQF